MKLAALLGALLLSGAAWGMGPTCEEFNAWGTPARTLNEVVFSRPTTKQIEVYRTAVAPHVGDIATFFLSSRARAVRTLDRRKKLGSLMGETLAMTRAFCYLHPTDVMEKVAFENVDYFLDAIAEEREPMKLREWVERKTVSE